MKSTNTRPTKKDAPRLALAPGVEIFPSSKLDRNGREELARHRAAAAAKEESYLSSDASSATEVIVEDDGGGCDQEQDAASSPFGRKALFLVGAALLVLLLVVEVILGVTIPSTTKNDMDSPSAITAAPMACTTSSHLDCLADILVHHDVVGAEALQDESSPQSQALSWLANEDPALLELDSTTPIGILVERYVLALLYFATNGEG
jgi:hypothetical protein